MKPKKFKKQNTPKKETKIRYNIVITIVYIVGIILLLRLFELQIVKGEEYREQSNTRLTRETKLKEKQHIYPNLIAGFIDWVMIYIKENNKGLNHKLYSFKEKKDYSKAIIHYISGMTDKYAIDIYNEIISF